MIQYSRRYTQPITQTASIANIIQSALAAAERVFEVLDEEEEPADKTGSQGADGAPGQRAQLRACVLATKKANWSTKTST